MLWFSCFLIIFFFLSTKYLYILILLGFLIDCFSLFFGLVIVWELRTIDDYEYWGLIYQEEIRNAPSANMMMNQMPNPNDLVMSTMRGEPEETPKPPPANRREDFFYPIC